jgi:hypothetical protein
MPIRAAMDDWMRDRDRAPQIQLASAPPRMRNGQMIGRKAQRPDRAPHDQYAAAGPLADGIAGLGEGILDLGEGIAGFLRCNIHKFYC